MRSVKEKVVVFSAELCVTGISESGTVFLSAKVCIYTQVKHKIKEIMIIQYGEL